jgi:hypothetical protein
VNFKWGLAPGAGGFVLSMLVGLFSGAGFPTALLRAGIFGVIFFCIGCGLWILINSFIPELLDSGKGTNEFGEGPGSRVDITREDSKTLPEM